MRDVSTAVDTTKDESVRVAIFIRHFQSRAWGKRPWHTVRPQFLLLFLVVWKNARQFHRGCTLKDSALPRDRDGTTRSSCPRTTAQARSRAVYSSYPPYFKQTHGNGGGSHFRLRVASWPYHSAAGTLVGTLHCRPFTTVVPFFPFIRSNRKIDLPLEGIDADNEDAYFVADAESFARSPANELAPRRFE